MRFITEEEFFEPDKPKPLGENTFGLFRNPDEETSLKYLKEGIYPSVFLHIDKRYKSNHPPLEKDYPFLKNRLSEKELKRMNEDYSSLMKEHLKELPVTK